MDRVLSVVEIDRICRDVCARFPKQVGLRRAGKSAIGFLVGEVMRATEGHADPKIAGETLARLIDDGEV